MTYEQDLESQDARRALEDAKAVEAKRATVTANKAAATMAMGEQARAAAAGTCLVMPWKSL